MTIHQVEVSQQYKSCAIQVHDLVRFKYTDQSCFEISVEVPGQSSLIPLDFQEPLILWAVIE